MKAFINVEYVRRDLVTVAILRHTCLYIRVEDHTDVIYVKSYLLSVAVLRDTADEKPHVRGCHKSFTEYCSLTHLGICNTC